MTSLRWNSLPWKPLAAALALALPAAAQAASPLPQPSAPKALTFLGTTHFSSAASAPASAAPASLADDLGLRIMPRHVPWLPSASAAAPLAPLASLPGLAQSRVVPDLSSQLGGFAGLSNTDQVFSGTGFYKHTNYTLEPPDQALAVGNGFELEAVNNAVAIYNTAGKQIGPAVPINQFFRQAPELSGGVYGESFSDPRAFYDPQSKRFLVEEWGQSVDPATGAGLPNSNIFLAVSKTSDPTGDYLIYAINTTYDSVSPTQPQIPDYTMLGADANGVYLSSNMFSLTQSVNPHVNFYVLPKAALVAGKSPSYVEFDGVGQSLDTNSTLTFTIVPATTPPGSGTAGARGGTEFFLSTPFEGSGVGSVLELWALSGTASLNSAKPALVLSEATLPCEEYAVAPRSQQKDGPRPLGQSLGQPVPTLESIGTRVMPIVYSQGLLWASLDTAVLGPRQEQAGLAYFVVKPSFDAKSALAGSIVRQGYVGVPGEDVSFPTIAVNASGQAVMTFALAGVDNYPSAAYVSFQDGLDRVHVSGVGALPADGFTGYSIGGGPPERWGDYSAVGTAEDGTIWLAQEYVPSTKLKPRTKYANWGTYLTHVQP